MRLQAQQVVARLPSNARLIRMPAICFWGMLGTLLESGAISQALLQSFTNIVVASSFVRGPFLPVPLQASTGCPHIPPKPCLSLEGLALSMAGPDLACGWFAGKHKLTPSCGKPGRQWSRYHMHGTSLRVAAAGPSQLLHMSMRRKATCKELGIFLAGQQIRM